MSEAKTALVSKTPLSEAARAESSAPEPSAPGELNLGGLESVLGFQLRRAHTVMQKDFIAALETLGLTQRQVATLWLIDANEPVSQSELAAALLMDRASMLAIIDKLDARGLIQRTRSEIDRRRLDLQLTERGEALLEKARALSIEHEKKFTSLFSEGELLVLRERLETI
ncbi:MAG: MarR family transcriptional regulator, partial [Maricaulaceae bacterium]